MDAQIRQLERAALAGDTDAARKLEAARKHIQSPRVLKFRFYDLGIVIMPNYTVYHIDHPNWCDNHKHKGRDAAKKCAIRLGKAIIRNQ